MSAFLPSLPLMARQPTNQPTNQPNKMKNMNAYHMIQILPVIAHISGWGSSMHLEVTDIQHRCNLVTSFRLGDLITVRRVEGSGEDYAQDRWIIDASTSSVSMVNMEWAGATLEFKRGMY